MNPIRILPGAAVLALLAAADPARAEVSEQEAIQAQLAGAMASADYATKHCPKIRIDQAKIASLTARSGMSAEELRASEDYVDQRDTIQSLVESQPVALICALLPDAHGGYARGILTGKD